MNTNGMLEKHDLNAAGLKINGSANNGPGFCTLCGKKSECKCDRCGDYYCSDLCQRKDWPNHRFICFPIPRLVKVGQCPASNSDISEKDSQNQLVAKDVKSSESTNLLPNGSCVLLTGFKSSNRCYVRSTNPSTVAEYDKVVNEINEFGKNSSALTERPKSSSYALALRGGKWSRVQVIGNAKDNFRIFFTDFGDIINKRHYKDMRKIAPSLVNLSCLIHMVQLKGISNYSIQSKLLNSLTQYTNKEYKIEFVKPDKVGGNVELFQWGTTISLNSLIQDLSSKYNDNDKDIDLHSVASSSSNVDLQKNENPDKDSETKSKHNISEHKNKTPISFSDCPSKRKFNTNNSIAEKSNKGKTIIGNELLVANSSENKKAAAAPRQIQKPCLEPPFEIIPLTENDRSCKIIIVDNSYIESGYIGCLLEKYCENLGAISKFLKEHNVGDQSYKPKLNEYCLANYENEWYRAKVVEIVSDDKFLVVYIDFTNEMELTSKSIRRYPMSLNLPCCTTLCSVDGLPEDISDEMKNFLELNTADFSALNIDTVRIEDDIRYIKSDELLEKMRDSKLL